MYLCHTYTRVQRRLLLLLLYVYETSCLKRLLSAARGVREALSIYFSPTNYARILGTTQRIFRTRTAERVYRRGRVLAYYRWWWWWSDATRGDWKTGAEPRYHAWYAHSEKVEPLPPTAAGRRLSIKIPFLVDYSRACIFVML